MVLTTEKIKTKEQNANKPQSLCHKMDLVYFNIKTKTAPSFYLYNHYYLTTTSDVTMSAKMLTIA